MVHSIHSPDRIPSMMTANRYDVILLDESCLSRTGKEDQFWVRHIGMSDNDAIVVVTSELSRYGRVKEAMSAGAFDVLPMPWPDDLADLVEYILQRKQDSMATTSKAAAEPAPDARLVGVSSALHNVLEQVDRVAKTDANVLILGENGTGKELVARALHRRSKRSDCPFVSVDMGAITETLFESELFGHQKGAFTDAIAERTGKFEAADGGTLFLDEIGNLSLSLQAKLLTVLQNRRIVRVGSNSEIPVDIHLICATNQPILDDVADGTFRQDLLYRINTVEIRIPPLRERPEDIGPLAEHFLADFRDRYNPEIEGLSKAGLRKLERHDWPGNVRELRHVIQRAVIMSGAGLLSAEDLLIQQSDRRAQDCPMLAVDSLHLETVEKAAIETAMNRHHGVVAQAARELGLTRSTLYRRLEKHGL
jgi:DNA-binding NtrC family response regulator